MKQGGGVVVSIVLVVLSTAHAASAAEPAVAPVENAIVAAKRDFEAIKSAAGGAEQQKLNIPAAHLPVLDTTPDAPVILSPLARQKLEDQPSTTGARKDWLVDAMMGDKPDLARTAKSSKFTSSSADPRSNVLRSTPAHPSSSRDAESARSNGPTDERRVELQTKSENANPLASFMTSWISPRDVALLTASKSADAPGWSPGEPRQTSNITPASGVRSSRPIDAVPLPGQAEAANPYLTSVPVLPVLPGPGVLAANSPVMSNPARPATSLLTPLNSTPPPAETRPPVIDALKPDRDSKYFKQLKRF